MDVCGPFTYVLQDWFANCQKAREVIRQDIVKINHAYKFLVLMYVLQI